jgi:hypothetical protein
MNCSAQEAFTLFFNVWRDDKTLVLVKVVDPRQAQERCTVSDTFPSQGSIRLKPESEESDRSLKFSGATFSFEDFRGTSPPAGVTRRWLCHLRADFPDGKSVLFSEPIPGMEDAA